MKTKTKKIIAAEVLIFFSICIAVLLSTCIMMIINAKKKEAYHLLLNQQENLILKKDSLLSLPWNLNWDEWQNSTRDWTPPKDAIPMPPKPDLAYALKNPKNKKEIRKLISELQLIDGKKKELKPIDIYEKNLIILFVLFGILYVLRPLFYLLIWSLRTLKE